MSENPEITADDLRIPSATAPLAATVRAPGDAEPRAAVVIHPATDVPRRMYTGFAEFLAENGYLVVTYDYAGIAESGPADSLAQIQMRDWMFTDVPAVTTWMREQYPQLALCAIGHSVGGHALALNSGTEGVRAGLTIASHAGVTAAIESPLERARVWAMLRVIGPVSARFLDRTAYQALGIGEDMPAAAINEWSGWSTKPNYFYDDDTMDARRRAASTRLPLTVIGFSDDPWATPRQINAMFGPASQAVVKRRTYAPQNAGVKAIRHMGFFRRGMRETLWPIATEWLEENLTA